MACGTHAADFQKTRVICDPLEIYLGNHGLLKGLSPARYVRMIAIARLIATEPQITQTEICKRLVLAKITVRFYRRAIMAKQASGELELSPFAEVCERELGDIEQQQDYDSGKSFNLTLQLIVARKKQLLEMAEKGLLVSSNEIKNLNDAEAKINQLPQHQDFKPVDFYDQLSERVPVEVSIADAEAMVEAEYEEVGQSGDLSADEYADAEGLDVSENKGEDMSEDVNESLAERVESRIVKSDIEKQEVASV